MRLFATLLIYSVAILPTTAQVQSLDAWWIDNGADTAHTLGSSIVPVGDLNDDDLADFAAATSSEKVLIYFGSTEPDTVPDLIIYSPDTSVYYFGHILYSLGDINGDGQGPDLGVRAYSGYMEYSIYIYWGGDCFDTDPDFILMGPQDAHSSFGVRAAINCGDFNGDGWDDLAVGDPTYWISGNPYIRGKIFLYYGGFQLDDEPDWTFQSSADHDYVGMCLAAIGDYNSDGYADFVAGDAGCHLPGTNDKRGVILLF